MGQKKDETVAAVPILECPQTTPEGLPCGSRAIQASGEHIVITQAVICFSRLSVGSVLIKSRQFCIRVFSKAVPTFH